jgi:hypothetical protein
MEVSNLSRDSAEGEATTLWWKVEHRKTDTQIADVMIIFHEMVVMDILLG